MNLTTWSQAQVPVYLQDLTAVRSNEGVHLTWAVQSAGAGEFVVRRAIAGRLDETIVSLPATGQTVFSTVDYAAPTSQLTYRLYLRSGYGSEALLGQVSVAASNLPLLSRIRTVAPNPFNPIATIRFSVAQASPVSLVVYDLTGRRVCTLVDETRQAGDHTVIWQGRDNQQSRSPTAVICCG